MNTLVAVGIGVVVGGAVVAVVGTAVVVGVAWSAMP
jgi:hypothetical protein